jgi:hypothetical protein
LVGWVAEERRRWEGKKVPMRVEAVESEVKRRKEEQEDA